MGGHGVASTEPAGQYPPAGHGSTHVVFLFVSLENVPRGQGSEPAAPAGQYFPAGHVLTSMLEFLEISSHDQPAGSLPVVTNVLGLVIRTLTTAICSADTVGTCQAPSKTPSAIQVSPGISLARPSFKYGTTAGRPRAAPRTAGTSTCGLACRFPPGTPCTGRLCLDLACTQSCICMQQPRHPKSFSAGTPCTPRSPPRLQTSPACMACTPPRPCPSTCPLDTSSTGLFQLCS